MTRLSNQHPTLVEKITVIAIDNLMGTVIVIDNLIGTVIVIVIQFVYSTGGRSLFSEKVTVLWHVPLTNTWRPRKCTLESN